MLVILCINVYMVLHHPICIFISRSATLPVPQRVCEAESVGNKEHLVWCTFIHEVLIKHLMYLKISRMKFAGRTP